MAKSYVYRPDDLKYSENWAREIGKTAQFLDVDPEAIAGFLQKEINDRTNRAETGFWGNHGVKTQGVTEKVLLRTARAFPIPLIPYTWPLSAVNARYINPWPASIRMTGLLAHLALCFRSRDVGCFRIHYFSRLPPTPSNLADDSCCIGRVIHLGKILALRGSSS